MIVNANVFSVTFAQKSNKRDSLFARCGQDQVYKESHSNSEKRKQVFLWDQPKYVVHISTYYVLIFSFGWHSTSLFLVLISLYGIWSSSSPHSCRYFLLPEDPTEASFLHREPDYPLCWHLLPLHTSVLPSCPGIAFFPPDENLNNFKPLF